MAKAMTGLKFYFRNGETWSVNRRFIGDLWIKQVSTSFGRIGESEFVEIHPAQGFKVEIFQEADHVTTEDINLGGLELGMFSRALKYQDIEKMDILYHNASPDLVYFPYKDKATPFQEGLDNEYQSTKVSDSTKALYIVIDPAKTVEDVYADKF